MRLTRLTARAVALGLAASAISLPAFANPQDYRFELAGKPQVAHGKNIVRVRLVHLPDNKPVADAVIFESRADMGPAGMETMTAPIKALPAQGGTYSFEVEPGMTGKWALRLAAKVQGEPGTVRGTVTTDLVK